MGMGSSGGGSRAVPYINVTPLIDVLLVVLIIFMVVTPLKPSRFQADIPTQKDPNENTKNLKPNPLTLVVFISNDLNIKLNNNDSPQQGEPCYGLVPRYGSANDPGNLAKCLDYTFKKRTLERAYKPGMETRGDLFHHSYGRFSMTTQEQDVFREYLRSIEDELLVAVSADYIWLAVQTEDEQPESRFHWRRERTGRATTATRRGRRSGTNNGPALGG